MDIDEDYCDDLNYALPPTSGWGMGVDRLCALLTNAPNIKETMTFPLVKDQQQ